MRVHIEHDQETDQWTATLEDGSVVITENKKVLEDFLDYLENRNASSEQKSS